MASRKEYEMLFALNARMNGGFSGTFSKAQAEFSRLGKEIQELQKIQGNISSYQKQQGAIEATRSKLENLQKQHDLLQKEISETTGSTAALEREKVKLEQRIKDTAEALDRQAQKLQSTEAKLKEAGVDTANLAQKDAELTAKIKELQSEQDKAADSAANFGARATQAFDAIAQSAITSQIVDVLGEIKDAFMDCVEGAGSFEEAMSTVEALSQANALEMAALSAEAKELGATTKFTAKESADAMGYMAMAGWDATDMLQGMDGVLQLAAASGEDLAMVSDIVTDSLSAFGLTAKDTAHFSDVLAAAATNSNTNVAIMGETFKMSASVAGALGYSIEDVAVAMGLMANSGVKGSIAGTALRNTFNGLLEGVTLTGAAFGEYEYSAIKADGTMKDFGSTIDELRGYFDQMTEAERVNNAQAIAGQRGYNGLLAILNATDEDYTSLTNSINNCTGAAQRMANVKLDNMNGQLTLMKSAWDALKTTIGEQFIPEMRTLYEVGTDVFAGIDKFIQNNPGVVKGIAAAAIVIGGVTAAVTTYTAAVKLAAAATALVPGAGQIMAITAAVAGVVGVVTALATAADDSVPSVKELTEAARDMQEAMDEAGTAYEETAHQTLATAEVASIYIGKLEEIEAATNGATEGNQEYHNILALLTRTVPELADDIDLITDTINGGTEALRQHTEAWKKDAEAQAYQDYINSLYDQYGEVMAESAENSIKLTEAQIKLQNAEKNWDAALVRMNELSNEACENGTALTGEYYQLESAINGYRDEMYEAERTIENSALESQITYWQDYNANLQSLTERSADIEGLSAVIASFADGSEDSVNAIAGLANASDEDLRAMVTNWQELQKEQEAAAGSVADLKTDFSATMDELQQELAADIEAMDLGDEAAASGRATIQGYIDAANDMLPEVQAAYKALAQAASNAMGTPSYINSAWYVSGNRGYATGTESAEPGWAMVGENGPELMFFNGGEKVLNAAQTSALQAKSEPAVSAKLAPTNGSKPPVSVTFEIQGNATQETVQDLRQFADEIVARVMDTMEDAEADEARGAFR